MGMSVCPFICLSVCPHAYLMNHISDRDQVQQFKDCALRDVVPAFVQLSRPVFCR